MSSTSSNTGTMPRNSKRLAAKKEEENKEVKNAEEEEKKVAPKEKKKKVKNELRVKATEESMSEDQRHEEYNKFVLEQRKKEKQDRNFALVPYLNTTVMIRGVYKKVRSKYDQLVDEELRTTYLQTLKRLSGRRRAAQSVQGMYRPPFKIERPPNAKCMKKAWIQPVDSLDRPQSCPLVRLKVTTVALPPMPYWVLAESNVRCPDNLRLSHVPYVDEGQDDDNLVEHLNELFDEGIHGFNDNFDYMNDWILYEMLKLTFEAFPQHKKLICYAFYELFPNKYSYRKLPGVFERLKLRFSNKSAIENLEIGPAAAALMDFEGETQVKKSLDEEEDELMKLYAAESLNCRQCSTYDCQAHGFMPLIQDSFKSGTWFPKDIPIPKKANKKKEKGCHQTNCYKHMARDEIIEAMGIEPEDVGDSNIVYAWYSKHVIQRITNADEFVPLLLFVDLPKGQEEQSFCEYVKKTTLPSEYDGCKKFYELCLKYIEFPTEAQVRMSEPKVFQTSSNQLQKFRAATWAFGGEQLKNLRNKPCNHDGPCGKSDSCACKICTKYCKCDDTCRFKFPGCRCGPGQCRTSACPCFYADWECDPETCKSCVCDSFEPSEFTCKNSSLGKGYQKKIRIEPSAIAGYGAILDESTKKGELISEYTGELITQAEAERRGQVCDRMKLSYIFNLNDDWVIDAQRVGNNIRFANHSDSHANCFAKVCVVNTQNRIGIYAKTDLKPGTELLFDYNYNKQHKQEFVERGSNGKKTKSKKRTKSPIEESFDSDSDDDGPSTSTAPPKRR